MEILIKGCRIPTPYFFAPINTGFSVDGEPDARLIRFHGERSGRGIGVAYVGNVAIKEEFRTNLGTLFIGKSLEKWKYLTKTILANGSIPAVQLACRLPGPPSSRKWRTNFQDKFIARTQRTILDLDPKIITKIKENFIQSAIRSAEAGFQIIQIHAAHGYFFSQMMNRKLNLRKDAYRFSSLQPLEQIIRKIRYELPNILIDIRVSMFDGLENSAEENYRVEQIEYISRMDVDCISLSAGLYDVDRAMIYPEAEKGHAVYLKAGYSFSEKYPACLWNIAGNIWDLEVLKENHKSNLTYSIGRSLIADPAFVEKYLNGRVDEVHKCVRAGYCHYYSRGRSHIKCKINPNIGSS